MVVAILSGAAASQTFHFSKCNLTSWHDLEGFSLVIIHNIKPDCVDYHHMEGF